MNAKRDAHRMSEELSVDIHALSKSEWRVSAPEATGPAHEILGYVEQLDSHRFEILWMSEPMHWGYAASLSEAICALADGARFTGEVTAERDSALRHVELNYTSTTFTTPNAVRAHHRSTWVTHQGSHVA